MLTKFEINGIMYPVVPLSSVYNKEKDCYDKFPDVIYYWEKGEPSYPWFKATAFINGQYFEGIGNDGTSKVPTLEASLLMALNDIKSSATVEIISEEIAAKAINEQDNTTKEGLEIALDMALRYIESLEFEKYKLQLQGKSKRNVVCLCGSTKFKEAFIEANRTESINGNIVLTVAMFGHLEGLDMSGPEKAVFDELHFDKISLADEILVLNVKGYIGESTRKEIEFAKKIGKRIRYLEEIKD